MMLLAAFCNLDFTCVAVWGLMKRILPHETHQVRVGFDPHLPIVRSVILTAKSKQGRMLEDAHIIIAWIASWFTVNQS